MTFTINEVDRRFFASRLEDFVPSRLIDIHAHVWLSKFKRASESSAKRSVTWPSRVAADNSMETLAQTYEAMFPGRSCSAMVFGMPDPDFDVDRSNEYIAREAGSHGFTPALLSRPEWDASGYASRMADGGFLGAKVYLNFAPHYIPGDEIRITDFAPHHQLEVLDDLGAILILHIPRKDRLRDPVNLHQMVELDKRYGNLKIVIAHIGRAYCHEDLGDAFEFLKDASGLYFDLSANTNHVVFEAALRAVGPQRLLYGSDLPITRMRMRRTCEAGRYVNHVPPGLYGDLSDDPNMRETTVGEGQQLTLFLYEEIDAFRRAAQRVGLSGQDVIDVFHDNAASLIESARRAQEA